MLKKYALLAIIAVVTIQGVAQEKESARIERLTKKLDSLETSIIGLTKKVDFNVSNIELPSFLRAVASTHKVNMSIEPELKSIRLTHNFSNASVKNVLLYLCKEYSLTVEPIGNIFAVKKHIPRKTFVPRVIPVTYDKEADLLSIDLQNDSLSVAFKRITNITDKNLVYSVGLGSRKITSYIKNMPFESALDKIAYSNNLTVQKTKDNYHLFEAIEKKYSRRKPMRKGNSTFFFEVKDSIQQVLNVDFENTPVVSVINEIGFELNVNMFTNVPLADLGTASVKADNITYDVLLTKILEDTKFTYKKKNGIYYFGKRDQSSLRSVVTVPLVHRSIEIMTTPIQNNRRAFNNGVNINQNSNYNNQVYNNQNFNQRNYNNQRQNINTGSNNNFGANYLNKAEALVNILPKEVTKDLEVKTDVELNSFIVSGDAQKIEKFKEFIKKIDKPVPVILIEVMILEVNKSASVSTGVEFGLGESPVKDKGTLFSSTDVTLGATTINKIIGGFNGFGSLNIGRVVPNFYAKIQAMETNGNLKVKSTPKLSTLNGHEALLSNGEQSYYAITRRDIIGSQNPQTTEIKNYVPINADMSIAIRPLVSGDNQITLSINVTQSSFNGKRIDAEAPPGMNSREFTSTIRVKDQDVVILGGLEENLKNDSGSGVPFLARIPVIKWLFSKKTRTASKMKLSVLIKPTIIR